MTRDGTLGPEPSGPLVLGPSHTWRVRRFFANLGPGLITGAADDDPSGISTYSVAGAAFGYAPLWTALFSFPLMAAVQEAGAANVKRIVKPDGRRDPLSPQAITDLMEMKTVWHPVGV